MIPGNILPRLILILLIAEAIHISSAQQISSHRESLSFVELYDRPLNASRYLDFTKGYSMQFDQDYERWTWYNPPYLQTGSELPGIQAQTGLRARLSQEYCDSSLKACCTRTKCSNWAGAHLVSKSCFQYGVFEWEALVNMSSDSNSRFFWALYVMRDSNMDSDSTWNEIDVGFGNGPTDGMYFSAAFFSPELKMWRYSDKTTRKFTKEFASNWHNYTLIWTPTSLEWQIDGVKFKSFSNTEFVKVPWRCMSYRMILRTDSNVDTDAGDSLIYLKRFQYKTLDDYNLSLQK